MGFQFDLSVPVGLGNLISFAVTGTSPDLTIHNFSGHVKTIDGNTINADYAGAIGSSGIEIKACDLSVGTQDCVCQICDNKESVQFECPPEFPALTTSGQCFSPLLFDP